MKYSDQMKPTELATRLMADLSEAYHKAGWGYRSGIFSNIIVKIRADIKQAEEDARQVNLDCNRAVGYRPDPKQAEKDKEGEGIATEAIDGRTKVTYPDGSWEISPEVYKGEADTKQAEQIAFINLMAKVDDKQADPEKHDLYHDNRLASQARTIAELRKESSSLQLRITEVQRTRNRMQEERNQARKDRDRMMGQRDDNDRAATDRSNQSYWSGFREGVISEKAADNLNGDRDPELNDPYGDNNGPCR